MNIHEYQGKELFKKFGVAVPRGVFCQSVDEAVRAAETLGGKVWVVEQVVGAPVTLAGDRAPGQQLALDRRWRQRHGGLVRVSVP